MPKVDLITTLICRQYFAEQQMKSPNAQTMPVMFGQDNPQCHTPEIQSMVSKFTLYGNVITGLLSAITSPKLGSLSDRYGRTRIICLVSLGMLATEVITILAASMPDTISVNWLLLSFFLDGLSGSFVASMALTHAYATDCTPPAKRNVTFGYFHGCLFTGIALGPLFAGFVVKSTGSIRSVFWFAFAAHLFFLSFVLFFVPESLSEERQHAAREKAALAKSDGSATPNNWYKAVWNTLRNTNLFTPLKTLWPTGPGSSAAVRRNLVAIAAVDTVMFAIAMGSVTVVIIYAEGMFHWNTFQASVFVSIANICRVTNLIVILPLVCRLIRGPRDPKNMGESGSDNVDLYIIRAAILFDILGYVGYSTVRTGPLFIMSGVLASIGGMGSPTLQSALTKHVPPEQTGAVLGAAGLLHALGRVVGPVVFNGIFSATVGKFKQTVFVCLGSTFGLAFVLSWFIRPFGEYSASVLFGRFLANSIVSSLGRRRHTCQLNRTGTGR